MSISFSTNISKEMYNSLLEEMESNSVPNSAFGSMTEVYIFLLVSGFKSLRMKAIFTHTEQTSTKPFTNMLNWYIRKFIFAADNSKINNLFCFLHVFTTNTPSLIYTSVTMFRFVKNMTFLSIILISLQLQKR